MDKMRDTISGMLADQGPTKKARPFLTNGEKQVLKSLQANAEIQEGLRQGRVDRYLLRNVMTDLLPLPISVVEKLAGKFINLLESGHINAKFQASKALNEAMAQATDVASDSGMDDLGMYGIGSGADKPEPKGDADQGVGQGDDHGDDKETASDGYMKEEEEGDLPTDEPVEEDDDEDADDLDVGEAKDDLPDHLHQKIFGEPKESDDDDEDDVGLELEADDAPQLTTQPQQGEAEGDEEPEEEPMEAEGDEIPEDPEAAAESIVSKWRARFKKAVEAEECPPEEEKCEDDDEDDGQFSPDQAESKRLKKEAKALKSSLKGIKEAVKRINRQVAEGKVSEAVKRNRKTLKAEKRAIKARIRRIKEARRRLKSRTRVRESGGTPYQRKVRSLTMEIKTLKSSLRRLKEQRRIYKKKIREQGPGVTPDADKDAKYDKLELVKGVADYSKGAAQIEAEELHPEDPGDGSKGSQTVSPSQDTRDALEADGEDSAQVPPEDVSLEAEGDEEEPDIEMEAEELKPEEPGDGSVGKTTSPAKDATIVKGIKQNEKRRKVQRRK